MSRRRPSGSIDDDETSVYEGRPKKDTAKGHAAHGDPQRAIRVISMKTPGIPGERAAMPHPVKLRALSEVSGPAIQIPLGNLAPPRDEAESARRRVRSYLIVTLAVLVVAGLVAVGVVLIAG